MTEITKAHILECYGAFKAGKTCPYPEGMTPGSAKDTMNWLKAIWNDKQWTRSFNAIHAKVILTQIKADYGEDKARQVAHSIERDINLQHQKYGRVMKKHRSEIEIFL